VNTQLDENSLKPKFRHSIPRIPIIACWGTCSDTTVYQTASFDIFVLWWTNLTGMVLSLGQYYKKHLMTWIIKGAENWLHPHSRNFQFPVEVCN
jgi:hypothetical protein